MIDKILSVSTGNITEQDSKTLDKEEDFNVSNSEYGYFIYSKLPNVYQGQYSEAFHNIIILAQTLNCRFICFDRDADYIPGFRQFDW